MTVDLPDRYLARERGLPGRFGGPGTSVACRYAFAPGKRLPRRQHPVS
jgi:hypothetical protein